MRISDRFTDYGITGSFFLIGLLVLVAFWGQVGWIATLGMFITRNVPTILQPSAISLLVVLAIIGIFFFGVLLDLWGSLGKQELFQFKQNMFRNKAWLREMTNAYSDYFPAETNQIISDSYNEVLIKEEKDKRREGFKLSSLDIKEMFLPILQPGLSRPYHRLRYFFFSFIFINSGALQLDILFDQTHLWRVSRALFTAVFILTYGNILLFLIWVIEAVVSRITAQNLTSLPFSAALVTLFVTELVLCITLYIARYMARAAYGQLCSTLFSLTYLSYRKNLSPNQPSQQ